MLLRVSQVYFEPEEVYACIVTCGGLCPGLNTVIREIVCGLYHMYGVHKVLGIEVSKCISHYNQTHSRAPFGSWKVQGKKYIWGKWKENGKAAWKCFLFCFPSCRTFWHPKNRPTLWFYCSTLGLVCALFMIVFKTDSELDVKRMDDQMASTKEVSLYI